jgi:glycerol uptake operon antiterminator
LLSIQRVFALDSKGLESIDEMVKNSNPHLIEIMPGVVEKAITRFSKGRTPVIAGGLIETKAEVTGILRCGAIAVSTGKKELWYV